MAKETNMLHAAIDIPVPESLVVVDRKDWERMKNQNSDEPVFADKKWLKKRTQLISEGALYERLLDKFRDELDMDRTEEGSIHYPRKSGDPLRVYKPKFNNWLEQNWQRIFGY